MTRHQIDPAAAVAFVETSYQDLLDLFNELHAALLSGPPREMAPELARATGAMHARLHLLAPDTCTRCGARFDAKGNLGDGYYLCDACAANLRAETIALLTKPEPP